mgnify:CR=1 FL=1
MRRGTPVWVLYARLVKGDARRRRIKAYYDEGEASAALCSAVLMAPHRDWKLVKKFEDAGGEG